MAAPDALTALPSWLLSQAADRGHRVVTDALAAEGLRKPHFSALLTLRELGPTSQAALGRRLWVDRSDVTGVLGELERRGAIARAPDPDDRRRNVVTVTPEGDAVLDRLQTLVAQAQATLLDGLDAAEQRELHRLLGKLLGGP